MEILSPFISVILTDSSTDSPVHILMLSIQAVRGLPRLRAPGIVPCIISFFRQLPYIMSEIYSAPITKRTLTLGAFQKSAEC